MDKIIFGCDYNPEQWSPTVWDEDIKIMQEVGINAVSLGIFSWGRIQPREGVFDFDWLDDIISRLHRGGIGVVLATATAAQPAWLSRKPGVLPVNAEGITISYGSRQTYCPNSAHYAEGAAELVTALAKRYKDNPAVIMWHLNNEYGCHTNICYCDTCAAKYREWLKEKYGSLETLNEAWGTTFWSQHYGEWDEIIPPRKTAVDLNPAHLHDYRLFMNESFLNCMKREIEIIKEYMPNTPYTTNFTQFSKWFDYSEWADALSLVAIDNYPSNDEAKLKDTMLENAMLHERMRGLGDGKPHILMEQAANQVNWGHRAIRPGTMRLWSYQAVARGADAVMYFQFRQSLKGAERFHSAIVPHAGTDTRVFRQVKQLGKELENLAETVGSREAARAAIVFDYHSYWSAESGDAFKEYLWYVEQIRNYYRPFYNNNMPVDFIDCKEKNLSKYDLIILPMLNMVEEGFAERIKSYTAEGGYVIFSFFSGVVDGNQAVFPGGAPGPFRDLLGITVEEFDALPPECANRIITGERIYTCNKWGELIKCATAKPIAVFGDDYYKDMPCATQNDFGNGCAYYVATNPDEAFIEDLMREIWVENGMEPIMITPSGVEAVKREKNGREWYFILNTNPFDVKFGLPYAEGGYKDLITGSVYGEEAFLEPKGCLVLKRV